MTVYLVHSGKSDPVAIKMEAESPAHVPTKITGDPGMVSYAQARADRGGTVHRIAAGWGTYSYLEREDGEEEPRCPSFDELLAELDARKGQLVENEAAAPKDDGVLNTTRQAPALLAEQD